MRYLLLAALLALSACGGGNSSVQPSAPPPPPTPRSTPLETGYFGSADLAKVANSVTFAFSPDWGDWNTPNYDLWRTTQTIMDAQEAKARGIPHAWVSVGFLLFTQSKGCTEYCLRVRPDGIARVSAFRAQLAALGLEPMVTVLYPVDEPELHGLDNATLLPVLTALRAAWPAKVAIIYGDTRSYPGLAAVDLAGKDNYGIGTRVLEQLPPLAPGQQWLIVSGGADPWRADPKPYLDFSCSHPQVYAMVFFLYADGYDGRSRGIGSNGMLPAYLTAGRGCT